MKNQILQIDNIIMLNYDRSRIMFDFLSIGNGHHTIFCIDREGEYVLHRWITRCPSLIDRECDGNKYKCKIIGIDQL